MKAAEHLSTTFRHSDYTVLPVRAGWAGRLSSPSVLKTFHRNAITDKGDLVIGIDTDHGSLDYGFADRAFGAPLDNEIGPGSAFVIGFFNHE